MSKAVTIVTTMKCLRVIKMKIHVLSPLGDCREVKRIHLNKRKNDLLYSCPKCKEEYSYIDKWFHLEPYGKSIMCDPQRYPIVDLECSNCCFVGVFFTLKELEEDHIIVEDGDFNLVVKKY